MYFEFALTSTSLRKDAFVLTSFLLFFSSSMVGVLPRYDGNKDMFASDARQVFSNCAYYNEDKSEVCVCVFVCLCVCAFSYFLQDNMKQQGFTYFRSCLE